MNWSKAKSILIIAFVVTNLILGYVLLSSEKQVETTTKESFIEDVIKLLDKKNIKIDGEIPREIPSLNTLSVEYENIDPYDINKRYFANEGKIESKGTGITELVLDNESILIKNRKTILYQNTKEENKYEALSWETAEELALDFLGDRGYKTDDMKLSHIINENKSFILEFTKSHGDRYLETSTTIIEVDKRGIKSMERIWLNVLEEGERPRYINTAPKAILSLLSIEEFYGKTISDISLCYYFDPIEQDFINNPDDTKKGNTVPGWRVVFKDGTKTIIDNN